MADSKINLRNTSLFNEIEITCEPDTVTDIATLCTFAEEIRKMPRHNTGEEILFYNVNIKNST